MKYIDADLLREEIVFMRDVYNNPKRVVQGVADAFRQDGRAAMCDDILAVMDAMEKDQQEQQDFPTTDEQMKEFLATHPKTKVPEKYKNPDWLFKKQEQQKVDLEKEIERYGKKSMWLILGEEGISKCAHHFYELGKNSK